jgi:DNA-directed RNA polymerase specialized sigma24 family protein
MKLTQQELEALYPQIRELARSVMRGERSGHTLQPTALANEAFIKMLGRDWRAHSPQELLNLSVRVMRDTLLDHARRRTALIRGGGSTQISLDNVLPLLTTRPQAITEIVDSIDALRRSSLPDANRKADVATLRIFGGLDIAETASVQPEFTEHDDIAAVAGISEVTVRRDWRVVKDWLATDLGGSQPGS